MMDWKGFWVVSWITLLIEPQMTANFMDIFTGKGCLHSQMAIIIAHIFKSVVYLFLLTIIEFFIILV